MTEGELNVPSMEDSAGGKGFVQWAEALGEFGLFVVQSCMMFTVGTYIYLLTGQGGSPLRGTTNHYFPYIGKKDKYELFTGSWKAKV